MPRTATYDLCSGPVAPVSDTGTRDLVLAKEGTGGNTALTPGTETKVEGMTINNETAENTFSKLCNFRNYI